MNTTDKKPLTPAQLKHLPKRVPPTAAEKRVLADNREMVRLNIMAEKVAHQFDPTTVNGVTKVKQRVPKNRKCRRVKQAYDNFNNPTHPLLMTEPEPV